MARIKSKALLPIQYPTLDPWGYIWAGMATEQYETQEELMDLTGFPRPTWTNWLYMSRRCPQEKQEKLHRIAVDMGWIKEEAIAA